MDGFLTAASITYSYPSSPHRKVLDAINFRAEKGEFVAVAGRNGSGKSTLVRILRGLISPQAGTVALDGVDIASSAASRSRIGIVFQNPDNQIVASTVEEDTAFALENACLPTIEIRIAVDRALDALGLSEYARRPPETLSGGQKQRLAIAGVLARDPDAVLFDEPTSMLDPEGRETVLRALKDIVSRGKTAVLVTHSMDEAALADRLVVLDSGRVAFDGLPREFFRDRETVSSLGLDLPYPAKVAYDLARAGMKFGAFPLTVPELAESICSR